ncbi:MAG: hypothetical protein MMC23_007119 [Stictis urceolatum]|nr:hypothetical protein [Stictis urceolata]
MPLPSRLLFTIRAFQTILATTSIYLLFSTFQTHIQTSLLTNPLTTLHYWLFGIAFTTSLLSLTTPIRDIVTHFSRRTRRRNYGSLGSLNSLDVEPSSTPSPRFRLAYEQAMLAGWLISAVTMLVTLDVEIGTMAWVAWVELLLFAASACLVERDVRRIRLLAPPVVKARSVSAGDVVFPDAGEKV